MSTVTSPGVLDRARRLHSLGLCVIPLREGRREPDASMLPGGKWESFQSTRPTDADLRAWFGNGTSRNIGIVLGRVSDDVVVVDTDTPEAEAWADANLPATPMVTGTARGRHRWYRRPPLDDIPAAITAGDGMQIELRRDGQYVVAPGSVHPSRAMCTELAPWPDNLDALPFLPPSLFGLQNTGRHEPANPLPESVPDGARNATLFREGCRLRRLGWAEAEIRAALLTLNRTRCHPPLEEREVAATAKSVSRYPPTADTFPLTEAGDAGFGEQVRYDHRRGRWLHFREHRWVPDQDGEILRLALEAIRGRQAAALKIVDSETRKRHLKWATEGEATKRQVSLLRQAQTMAPIADAGDRWDSDPWLLGVGNGALDLRTGELCDGRPEDRITMSVCAPYIPDARCPLWDRTVSEIFGGDHDLISYFDRYVGYSLTGDCREESLAFCWGEGANGKGTLMNTVGWLLGDYADDLPFSALERAYGKGVTSPTGSAAGCKRQFSGIAH